MTFFSPTLHDRQTSYRHQRACLEHLLDLKRAGHSPTRTELNIPSDGANHARRYASALQQPHSLIGSPGGMCAEPQPSRITHRNGSNHGRRSGP